MKARTLIAVCVLALVTAMFAIADEWNRKIEVTFNQPVSIPAVHQPGWGVLPPGTYVFKIMDSASDRHIVQIYNKNESEIYATILAVPNSRMKATDNVVITFRETRAGEPLALRAMFYPGREWGEEFVYPKAKATEIARATAEPVLSMLSNVEEEKGMPEAPEVIAELEKAPVGTIEPSGEEAALPPAPHSASDLPRELPKTASPVPLIALVGLLVVLTGVLLRPMVHRR
jgi:hypothetical protein